MSIQDYLKVYPNAKLVGPKALVSKRSELHFDIVQPENELDAELAKEFKAVALTGHPNEVSISNWYTRIALSEDLPLIVRRLYTFSTGHRMATYTKQDPNRSRCTLQFTLRQPKVRFIRLYFPKFPPTSNVSQYRFPPYSS